MEKVISVEQFKRVLPKNLVKNVTPELMDGINNVLADTDIREVYRENLLSYTGVLGSGKYTIHSYISAVKYVSFKLLGDSNVVAYSKVFPERYQRLMDKGPAPNEISAHVRCYNRTKLVNLILEQTLVPSHVLNADLYQKALNVQADLMLHAKSEKVKTDAANSLLNQLKRPEVSKIELDINVGESQAIKDLNETTLKLVTQQKAMLESGAMSLQDVAESQIIDSEAVEILEDN